MTDRKPPLALHTEIETADGDRYRWDGEARDPGKRPQSISCGSKIGEGYGASSVTLARQGARTYPDIDEFSTVRHIGVDGEIAYEGRIAATPRSSRKIEVQAVGWMSHARDTPIPSLLIIDRDLSNWGSASVSYKTSLATASYQVQDATPLPDATGGSHTLQLAYEGAWAATVLPACDARYDAGPGQKIGRIYLYWGMGGGVTATAPFAHRLYVADVDDNSAGTAIGDNTTLPSLGTLFTLATPRRFAHAEFRYDAGGAGTQGFRYIVNIKQLTAYGDHGLPLQGAAPAGVLASDIIRYVAGLYCPLLDTGGVRPSPSIIDQFLFKEQTYAFDVFTKANAYDRYNIAVWNDRKLTYEPMPSETADPTWIVRSSDGNGLDPNWTGPSTAASANGILVRFQNVLTGSADYVSPDTNAALADARDTIAANRAGIKRWEAIQLPDPNSPNGAAEIGRAVLAEFNRPRKPGDITIRGHIRDAAGSWRQGWRVKAGETVLLADDPDAIPQTIWEPGWTQDTKTLVMHVDAPAATADSILADILTTRSTRTAA